MSEKRDLRDLAFSEQNDLVFGMDHQIYRAQQIREWLYQKGCRSIRQMSNLPGKMRGALEENYTVVPAITRDKLLSSDGTAKYLLGLADGNAIETVMIPEGDRTTICVSTQVGCRLGCGFCATGAQGYTRDLMPSEIFEQVRTVAIDVGGVTNVVFMGMGEPLDNLDSVLIAIEALNSRDGMGIGSRRITVSTAGVIPGLQPLAERGHGVNLAVSLHSADDDTRSRIMPVNRKYPVADLLSACRDFPLGPYRKLTFEVALFDGVNDSIEQAEQMAIALSNMRCTVNIIEFNAVDGAEFAPASNQSTAAFRDLLSDKGVRTTRRRSRGADIDAACGQLRGARSGL